MTIRLKEILKQKSKKTKEEKPTPKNTGWSDSEEGTCWDDDFGEDYY